MCLGLLVSLMAAVHEDARLQLESGQTQRLPEHTLSLLQLK